MKEQLSSYIKKKILIFIAPYALAALGILFIIIIFMVLCIKLELIDTSGSGGSSSGMGYESRECGFTISKTSLSKSEYVEKLEQWAISNPKFQPFADYAEDIYEQSESKNVNPELVVVRAYAEGRGDVTGTHNYWGLGCTNESEGAGCYNFDDFEEGYTYFIDVVTKYDSLADMMKKYAYIGQYWYTLDTNNPSGDGGCYYAEHIYPTNMPIHVQQACAPTAPSCVINGDTTNCTKTTKEDQKAYATWQVKQNMGTIRKTIFGLEFTEGPCVGGLSSLIELSSYTLKHEGLTKLNRTLNEEEITELNAYINESVDESGYGTGAGVAAAGQALTYGLEQKGYYLGYYWGGDRSSLGVGKKWGADVGIAKTSGNNPTGPEFGMDCSGFVSWAIRNACKSNFGGPDAKTFLSSYGVRKSSITEAMPGDILVNSGHVILIIKNNGDGTIIAAEEAYSSSGLVFKQYDSLGSYVLKDMSGYYSNNCNSSR